MDKKDSPFFRTEAKKQRESKDAQKNMRTLLLADIRETFSTPHGSRVLNWLLGLCHVGTSVFTGNSQTFYKSGQQDIGHEVLNHVIEAEPLIYATLLKDKAVKLKTKTTTNQS